MRTHPGIDARSLRLAQAVAARVDARPELMEQVRGWVAGRPERAYQEWEEILRAPWPEVRRLLLQDDEEGRRRRQSSPFVGILTPQERWRLYRDA